MKKLGINNARLSRSLALLLFLQGIICLLTSGFAYAAAPTDVPQLVASWGKRADAYMKNPQQMTTDKLGNIYVLDAYYEDTATVTNMQRLYKFDSSGGYLGRFLVKPCTNQYYPNEKRLAVDASNNVLVLCSKDLYIDVYNNAGGYLQKRDLSSLIGAYLKSLTGLSVSVTPEKISVDKNGSLYLSGNALREVGSSGYLAYTAFLIKLDTNASKMVQTWNYAGDYLYFYGVDFVDSAGVAYGVANKGYFRSAATTAHVMTFSPDGTVKWSNLSSSDFSNQKVFGIAKGVESNQFYLAASQKVYVLNQDFSTAGILSDQVFVNPQLTTVNNALLINDIGDYSPVLHKIELQSKTLSILAKHNHNDAKLDYPRNMVVDQQNSLLVLDTENAGYPLASLESPVSPVNYNGNYAAFKKYIGGSYAGVSGSLGNACRYISVAKKATADNALIALAKCPSNYSVLKLSNAGQVITLMRSNTWGQPYAIALDVSDNIYLYDNTGNRVLKYNKNGTFMTSLAVPDQSFILDMSIDKYGNFYLMGGAFISKLNNLGKLVTKWGNATTFRFKADASNLTLDSLGQVYVVDAGNRQIQKFSNTGNLLAKWKTPDQPVAVAVSATDNDVYVSLRDGRVLQYHYQ